MKWLSVLSLSSALVIVGVVTAQERQDASAPDGLRPGGTVGQSLPAPLALP